VVLSLTGCNDGVQKFDVEVATGKVTCNGKPIANVTILFIPMKEKAAGKTATALVGKMGRGLSDQEGNFKISTYGELDGAVIGQHQIRVGPPENVDSNCPCSFDMYKSLAEVIVRRGEKNEFEVRLAPSTGEPKPIRDSEDDLEYGTHSSSSGT